MIRRKSAANRSVHQQEERGNTSRQACPKSRLAATATSQPRTATGEVSAAAQVNLLNTICCASMCNYEIWGIALITAASNCAPVQYNYCIEGSHVHPYHTACFRCGVTQGSVVAHSPLSWNHAKHRSASEEQRLVHSACMLLCALDAGSLFPALRFIKLLDGVPILNAPCMKMLVVMGFSQDWCSDFRS